MGLAVHADVSVRTKSNMQGTTCAAQCFGQRAAESMHATALFSRTSPLQIERLIRALHARSPVHTPPWQEPLLHTVPFGLSGGTSHSPVAWLHALRRVSHSLRGGQVALTHMSAQG